jgi:hypothetical protein
MVTDYVPFLVWDLVKKPTHVIGDQFPSNKKYVLYILAWYAFDKEYI